MHHSARSILLADPDADSVRRLGTALRARGHQVLTARDGTKALELAVTRTPDVVLYDVACPLLAPRTFSEILRANPRTRLIPVVMLATEESDERLQGSFREAFLQKPFNVDEALGRIEQLLRRAATARDVQSEESLSGSLGEVPLTDLLQMLALNRRSGILHLEGKDDPQAPGGRIDVLIRSGRVVDARSETVEGYKALFRSLAWRRGTFAFSPEAPTVPGRLDAGLDEILLEGMRQLDELRALEGAAPDRDDMLALAVEPSSLPEGLHPVTLEVIELLGHHRTCGEVVDGARSTDLEALRAITTLMSRGVVRSVGRAPEDRGTRALVPSEVAYALHGWRPPLAGRRRSVLQVAVGGGPDELQALARELAGVMGWRPSGRPAGRSAPLGELGVARLTDMLDLQLMALPPEERLSPLWRPLGAGAAGTLVLAGEPGDPGLAALTRALVAPARPVAVVGEDPAVLAAAGSQAVRGRSGVEALGRLLERIARLRGQG